VSRRDYIGEVWPRVKEQTGQELGRAYSARGRCRMSWGVAPGWYGGAPLGLLVGEGSGAGGKGESVLLFREGGVEAGEGGVADGVAPVQKGGLRIGVDGS